MRSSHPEVRIEASRALAALSVPDAVYALLDALSDPIEDVRVAIVEALAGTTRADVVERLGAACLDPSVRVRCALAETLGRLESARAVELLADLVRDVSRLVATAAALSMLSHPDVEGQRRALDLWPSLPEATRLEIAASAGAIEEDLTEQALSSFDVEARRRAIRLLAALGRKKNASRIARALSDPDSTVRLCAVEELGELDIGEVEDWIRSLLEDPVASVRTAARRLLIKPI